MMGYRSTRLPTQLQLPKKCNYPKKYRKPDHRAYRVSPPALSPPIEPATSLLM